jgi:hypothetical protein
VTQHTPPGKTDFVDTAGRRCNRPVTSPASGQPEAPTPAGSSFALAPALRFRLLGTGLVAMGLVVLGGILLAWAIGLPAAFVTGLVLLAGVGVVTLGLLLGLRHWVLRTDEHGYRVRVLRSPARSGEGIRRRSVRPVARRPRPAGGDAVGPAVRGAPAARRAYDDPAGRPARG